MENKLKKYIPYLSSDIFKCCSEAQAESILLLHLTIFMYPHCKKKEEKKLQTTDAWILPKSRQTLGTI